MWPDGLYKSWITSNETLHRKRWLTQYEYNLFNSCAIRLKLTNAVLLAYNNWALLSFRRGLCAIAWAGKSPPKLYHWLDLEQTPPMGHIAHQCVQFHTIHFIDIFIPPSSSVLFGYITPTSFSSPFISSLPFDPIPSVIRFERHKRLHANHHSEHMRVE